MASHIPLHGRPKAMEQTKEVNLWNDRKHSPCIKGLTYIQFAEILLHQSVDKLCTGCRPKEAHDLLKLMLELLMGLHNSCHSQVLLNFCLQSFVLTRIYFNDFPLQCD